MWMSGTDYYTVKTYQQTNGHVAEAFFAWQRALFNIKFRAFCPLFMGCDLGLWRTTMVLKQCRTQATAQERVERVRRAS
jgi:hypothetical protein